MNAINKIGEELCWESPDGQQRQMGLLYERDITPTTNISAGTVRIPTGGEQIHLSTHACEEIYLVVQGKARFVLNHMEYTVKEGNTIYVAPGTKHRAINVGGEELLLYWVNSPPCFAEPESYKEFVKDWKRIR